MSEKQRFEKEPTPKSFIRVNGKEHNLKALIELLRANDIKINKFFARDPRPGAELRITDEFIPSISTEIEVSASYDDVRRVLESSDEFREHVNKILGSV
jgi:hypothetical protein